MRKKVKKTIKKEVVSTIVKKRLAMRKELEAMTDEEIETIHKELKERFHRQDMIKDILDYATPELGKTV